MEYIPPKGKKGKRLSVVLTVVACVGLICASVLDVSYRLFYQLVAVGIYIFSFEVLNRYHLTTYRYLITEEDFIITKRMGKRVQTVCCLSLSTLIGIEKKPKTKAEKTEFIRRYGKTPIRYNYCQSLMPKKAYCILFDFNGRCAQIIFEGSEQMEQYLKQYLRSKNELKKGGF
jgi:hypothetical protein